MSQSKLCAGPPSSFAFANNVDNEKMALVTVKYVNNITTIIYIPCLETEILLEDIKYKHNTCVIFERYLCPGAGIQIQYLNTKNLRKTYFDTCIICVWTRKCTGFRK